MDMATRLNEAMRDAGFGDNQSALSRASGVPQPTINRILKGGGKKGPETETVKKLAAACNVSFQWLMEGIGPKHGLYATPDPAPPLQTNEPSQQATYHLPADARRVEAVSDDVDLPGTIRIRKVKLRLSAGIIGFAVDEIEEDDNPIVFRRSWFESRGYIPEKLIAIRVKGESMEPGLYDGDTVVINTADTTPKDGEVYAVNYEGEAVVKRMIREIGSWWLVSDNQDQRRFPRKRCEGDMCIVIGRVIHKQSERI